MRRGARPAGAVLALLAVLPFGACGAPQAAAPPTSPTPVTPEPSASAPGLPPRPDPNPEPEIEVATKAEPKAESPCPDDMRFVEGTYCPKVERRCLKTEENKPNHLTLCHKFAHETRCLATEETRAFCIDEYEYPNRKGEHPPWMVSWFDAQATCQSKGKRLCGEGEWVMACEGPSPI